MVDRVSARCRLPDDARQSAWIVDTVQVGHTSSTAVVARRLIITSSGLESVIVAETLRVVGSLAGTFNYPAPWNECMPIRAKIGEFA